VAEPALQSYFRRLDRWRHLPAYRLEPRVDALLSLYLRGILEERTGQALDETILPELPLRLGTLWGGDTERPNLAYHVDFALFARDRSIVYLVEVKTDLGSRREEQDDYLRQAAALDFREIVDGILQISVATSSSNIQKYVHLLAALERLGFVRCPPALRAHTYPQVRQGVTAALRAVENVTPRGQTRVEVVYLQPEAEEGVNAIDFAALAAYARRQEDGIGPLLAGYLGRWQEAAGAVDPWG
jgi:hypothetical protein